jgi:hypothetical protein
MTDERRRSLRRVRTERLGHSMGAMRVRIALGLAVLATAIGLVIDMSGSAPRLAGDDHVSWPARDPGVAVASGGDVLCMHATVLPDDAARIVVPIHDSLDQSKRLPRIAVDFTDAAGKRVATGVLARGAVEGPAVSLPLRYPHGPSALGSLCFHVGGHRTLVFDGETGAGTTTVNGIAQLGSPAILYYRPGRESWWQLLGTLDFRFGLGKSAIFGDWTLPVLVLAALALWFGVLRFLVRELKG